MDLVCIHLTTTRPPCGDVSIHPSIRPSLVSPHQHPPAYLQSTPPQGRSCPSRPSSPSASRRSIARSPARASASSASRASTSPWCVSFWSFFYVCMHVAACGDRVMVGWGLRVYIYAAGDWVDRIGPRWPNGSTTSLTRPRASAHKCLHHASTH